jgi:hypothetical protein
VLQLYIPCYDTLQFLCLRSSQYAGGDDLPISEVQRRLFTTQELAAAAEAFAISTFIGEGHRRVCRLFLQVGLTMSTLLFALMCPISLAGIPIMPLTSIMQYDN